jgi:hypothetical protein
MGRENYAAILKKSIDYNKKEEDRIFVMNE